MNGSRESTKTWLMAALTAFASLCLGLILGWWLRGQELRAPVMPATEAVLQDAPGLVREQLEAARREILAQLELLSRQRSNGLSAPAATVDASVSEFGQRLAEFETRIALVDAMRRPSARGVAWELSRGPGSGSIEAMGERIREWDKREAEGENVPDVLVELRTEHHLWTIEDLVRTYGPPRRVTSGNGLLLYYGRFKREHIDEPCVVHFQIVEGFLIDFGIDCDSEW